MYKYVVISIFSNAEVLLHKYTELCMFCNTAEPTVQHIINHVYKFIHHEHVICINCIALAIIVDSDIKLSSVTGLNEDKNSPQSIPQAIFSMVTLGLLL